MKFMEFIRPDINIDFVGMRFKAFAISGILIIMSLVMVMVRGGLNLGVDFAGGTLIQVKFAKPVQPDEVREALKGLGVAQSTIQRIGNPQDNEFLIRTDAMSSELQSLSHDMEKKLSSAFGEGQASVRRVEMVGPKVGKDLREKAYYAIYFALLFIAIYISGRFEFKWTTSAIMAVGLIVGIYILKSIGLGATFLIIGAFVLTLVLCWFLKLPYALGAVVALVHDLIITVGFFALFDKEFTLEILAALLTLEGYSLNDTIIVYDRIRENLRKSRRQDFHEVINVSINQTLSRTILTSGITMIVVVSLFLLGGPVIHDFSFALLIGIITGTYSSIFVAAPLLILYEDWTRGKRPARKLRERESATTG